MGQVPHFALLLGNIVSAGIAKFTLQQAWEKLNMYECSNIDIASK